MFPGDVGLLPSMDTKGKLACFSRVPCMRRSQGTWGMRDSECLNVHDVKDSGTKIMAFECEGRSYESCFVSTIGQMICPNRYWVWTDIAHLLAPSVSSVNLQFHAVQNFLLPGTWFVRPRDFFALKLALPFSKAPRVRCLPNWLAFIFGTKSVLLSRVSLGKGCAERKIFPQSLRAQRAMEVLNCQQARVRALVTRVLVVRSFWWRQLAEETVPNRIPKSHWYCKISQLLVSSTRGRWICGCRSLTGISVGKDSVSRPSFDQKSSLRSRHLH